MSSLATARALRPAFFRPEVKADNVWGLLKTLCDNSKINMISFGYEDKSITPGKSAVNAHTGATTSPEVIGHRNSFGVRCASKSSLVYLFTEHSMRTKDDEGAFDFRTYRIASVDDSFVKKIRVLPSFSSKWEEYALYTLSAFPLMDSDEDKRRLAELLRLRAKHEWVKSFLEKEKDRLNRKHSARLKAGEVIVDGLGNPIKTQKFVRKDGIKLVPEEGSVKMPKLPEVSDDFSELPTLHQALSEVRDNLNKINTLIRPWELGVCEHSASNLVTLDDSFNMFVISRFEYPDYDYTEDQRAALNRGEYQIEKVPVSRGSYHLELPE